MTALPKTGVVKHAHRGDTRRLISHSELQSLECFRRHDFAYNIGLKAIQPAAALTYGTVWDAFLNEWHDPQGVGALAIMPDTDTRLAGALTAAQHALEKEVRRVDGALVDRGLPRPEGWDAQLDGFRRLLMAMALHYVDEYGDEPEWRTLHTQYAFEVPCRTKTGRKSSKYWFYGVVDALSLHVPSGQVYMVERKSAARIDANYRLGWSLERQMPRYGWALRELGWPIAGYIMDAAAKIVPTFPDLRKTPFPVYEEDGHGNVVLDEEGKPVHHMVAEIGEDGEPVLYKTGARKGEPKLKRATRIGLASMLDGSGGLQYSTTLDVMRAAIDLYGLDPNDYANELSILQEWQGSLGAESPYHYREDVPFTAGEIERAGQEIADLAPLIDTLPATAMPNTRKCGGCPFVRICPHDGDDLRELIAAGYTTRAQRKAAGERERAAIAAADAQSTEPF